MEVIIHNIRNGGNALFLFADSLMNAVVTSFPCITLFFNVILIIA